MVQFGANQTVITLTWAAIKSMCQAKYMPMQYDEDDTMYTIFAFDGPVVYTTIIYKTSVPDAPGFDQSSNDTAKTEFETSYKSIINHSIVPRTIDGRERKAVGKTDGSRTNFYSHNWCDKTTWYEAAVYVEDEIATDSGDQTTYTLSHQFIVDTYHGKITLEDILKSSANRSFRVGVKVNNVAKTEQDPHYGSGGDFTVNYEAGSITFLSPLQPTDVVKVTYHYATSSIFTFKPAPGKMLSMNLAECQFSANVQMNDTVLFEVYGNVEAFAPQYLQSNGGPFPPGYKINIHRFPYKTIQDFMNDSFRSYAQYPALGGPGWRGIQQPTVVFDWDYLASTLAKSSQGIEIRVRLEHDIPFGGDFATVTFYAISSEEHQ